MAGENDPQPITLTDELDLHHFHPRDARMLIHEFLDVARERGFYRVRIVHGRGRSVLKRLLYAELEKRQDIKSFQDDQANWGATIVILDPPSEISSDTPIPER